VKKRRFYEHFLEVLDGASDLAYNLKDRVRGLQHDIYGFEEIPGALEKIDELEERIVKIEATRLPIPEIEARLARIEKRLKLANDGMHCVDPGGTRGGPHVTVEEWNVDLNRGPL